MPFPSRVPGLLIVSVGKDHGVVDYYEMAVILLEEELRVES